MTLYHIYFCELCDLKAEISVKGEVVCGDCNWVMEKVGEMRAR